MNWKKVLKIITITILLIIAIFVAIKIFYQKSESEYQSDADIMRLRHLKYYSNLIEEYKEKTGKYPLQDKATLSFNNQPETFSVYVEIANEWQEEEAKKYSSAIPITHYNGSDKEFFEEIEKELGRTINEYYDPQKGSFGRPNFYVYTVNPEGNYYFAIHTYKNYFFSFPLAKNYNKIQVSNLPTDERSFQSNDLFSKEGFIKESEKEPKKAEFFSNLENEYLYESKTK